jgi:hypothetical protein
MPDKHSNDVVVFGKSSCIIARNETRALASLAVLNRVVLLFLYRGGGQAFFFSNAISAAWVARH